MTDDCLSLLKEAKMKKPVAIAASIFGLALISLCGFSSLVLLWLAASTTVPVSASDRQALVRADDLVPFFEDYSPTPAFEMLRKDQIFRRLNRTHVRIRFN